MSKSKELKRYFKCHICKWIVRKRYNECVLHSLKEGELPLCRYNTFFSIWKWIVRLLHIPLGFIFYIICYHIARWYFHCWVKVINTFFTGQLKTIWINGSMLHIAGNFLFLISHVLVLIGVIWGVHSTFIERGGYYYNEK